MPCITSPKDTWFVPINDLDHKTCKTCVKKLEDRREYHRVQEEEQMAEQDRQDMLRSEEQAREKCELERHLHEQARLQ